MLSIKELVKEFNFMSENYAIPDQDLKLVFDQAIFAASLVDLIKYANRHLVGRSIYNGDEETKCWRKKVKTLLKENQ